MTMALILVSMFLVPYVVAHVALARLQWVSYFASPYPAMLRLLRRDCRWQERMSLEKVAVVATVIHWMVLSFLVVATVLGVIRNALTNLT